MVATKVPDADTPVVDVAVPTARRWDHRRPCRGAKRMISYHATAEPCPDDGIAPWSRAGREKTPEVDEHKPSPDVTAEEKPHKALRLMRRSGPVPEAREILCLHLGRAPRGNGAGAGVAVGGDRPQGKGKPDPRGKRCAAR